MVKHVPKHEVEQGPPDIDESWWEAVLAEEETHRTPGVGKKNVHDGANPKSPSPASDLLQVDWIKAKTIYENDLTVHLAVTGYNRGGLLVSGDGLQGFVPLSHLVQAPLEVGDPEEWLANYQGQAMQLKVIECDPDRGRVVFSERAALAEPGTRNSLLQQIKPGDCVSGVVTNITDFGIFVDLGGVEGLIHVSEISWGRVHHPADAVLVGQDVDVFVIQVDRERARIALSLKRLYPNPWETAENRYYAGQVTEATITSLVPFGAFARLEDGLDGLIHISEIDCDGAEANLGNSLQEGQVVRVRVLHVDGTRQRLGLSLKLGETPVYRAAEESVSEKTLAKSL